MSARKTSTPQTDLFVADALAGLTASQRVLLSSMLGRPYHRVRGGWRQRGNANRITLERMDKLVARKMVSDLHGTASLTKQGEMVAREIRTRRESEARRRREQGVQEVRP